MDLTITRKYAEVLFLFLFPLFSSNCECNPTDSKWWRLYQLANYNKWIESIDWEETLQLISFAFGFAFHSINCWCCFCCSLHLCLFHSITDHKIILCVQWFWVHFVNNRALNIRREEKKKKMSTKREKKKHRFLIFCCQFFRWFVHSFL